MKVSFCNSLVKWFLLTLNMRKYIILGEKYYINSVLLYGGSHERFN